MVNSYGQFTAAKSDSQHIKISEQLHVIEAQERHEKSPKKRTSREARCGSLGGLLIYVCKCSDLFSLLLGHARQGLVQASGEHHVVSLEDVTVAEQMADTSPVAWSMMLPKPFPVCR